MIVVLDTNVVVSALLSAEGAPAEIMRRWEAGAFDVAISPALLSELERALKYEHVRKYFQEPPEKIDSLLDRFRTVGILVEPEFRLDVVEEDPDDDRVIECAVAAGASYIISGDKHLLDLEEYAGIVILTPVGFLALLELSN
jgi:hypothetical protein